MEAKVNSAAGGRRDDEEEMVTSVEFESMV
jgi:hypothetical protein